MKKLCWQRIIQIKELENRLFGMEKRIETALAINFGKEMNTAPEIETFVSRFELDSGDTTYGTYRFESNLKGALNTAGYLEVDAFISVKKCQKS